MLNLPNAKNIIINHQRERRKANLILLLLVLLLLVSIIFFTGLGLVPISAREIINVLWANLSGSQLAVDEIKNAVITEIRLPRVLLACLVGLGLAISGTVYQGILLNPLADPYTLGVSTGAAFGATLAIFFDIQIAGIPYLLTLPLFAFVGALLALITVYNLACTNGTLSVTNLILSGVIISAILSAAISFLKSLAGEGVAVIVFWLMGSFASRGWHHVWLCLPVLIVCTFIIYYYANELNILSLGSRQAKQLGVDEVKVRKLLLVAASLITAVCVSVCGIIGFVGLIVPHLMRMIVGPDHRILIPVSAVAGALLLSAADTVVRSALTTEVPVGVLTTLLGGPFFCYIFKFKNHRQNM